MTTAEYEAYVESRTVHNLDDEYCVVALNEEAGEIAGWYKKFVLRGNPTGKFQEADLKGELGDVLFYATKLARNHGWSLVDVMEHNKAKLDDRVAKNMRQIA